jgi:hypothetical protein
MAANVAGSTKMTVQVFERSKLARRPMPDHLPRQARRLSLSFGLRLLRRRSAKLGENFMGTRELIPAPVESVGCAVKHNDVLTRSVGSDLRSNQEFSSIKSGCVLMDKGVGELAPAEDPRFCRGYLLALK